MATLRPFRALRPNPADASRIAAVPYDVVSTDEARALADGNPLSFLRVSRAELELPPDHDPYAPDVYERAAKNFAALKQRALVVEGQPSVYFYRLTMGAHVQTGIAACYSIDEYDRGVIRKHERTRRDKEDDRTRHMIALGAQTGPVFLTYRAVDAVDQVAARAADSTPLIDFEAQDGVRHTLWRVGGADSDALVAAFSGIPALYIADGHHRAASAARARAEMRDRGLRGTSLGDGADRSTMLAVAFPHDQVQILPYNRIVKDLGGLDAGAFMKAVRDRFDVAPGPPAPARRGEIAMFFDGSWHMLRTNNQEPRTTNLEPRTSNPDVISSLDVTVLQDQLLAPVLGIADVRTDKRIDFVGGGRGTKTLQQLVESGKAALAFSLYPVSVADLMAVSDAGGIMPPKSTWFEPKLRDGLLSHVI
jgi:uncharacterized protein (DUF1015 family)